MNKYRKLADMCSFLAEEMANLKIRTITNRYNTRPIILRSEDGRKIEVVWREFIGMTDEDRSDMICEALIESCGIDAVLRLHLASGHIDNLSTTIGKEDKSK